jgi:excisionase family DNA binding protein
MVARLLTLAQAAEQLGCSLSSVKRRAAAGELPCFRDGRLVRVREADLERFVAERVARRLLGGAAAPAGRQMAPGERLWH